MKLLYDKVKITEGIEAKAYDKRNLAICKCGKHRYPSKLMFIRFLEQFKDVKGDAEIWSISHWEDGTVEIHVAIKYKIGNNEEKPKSNRAKQWKANLSDLPEKLLNEVIVEIDKQEKKKEVGCRFKQKQKEELKI